MRPNPRIPWSFNFELIPMPTNPKFNLRLKGKLSFLLMIAGAVWSIFLRHVVSSRTSTFNLSNYSRRHVATAGAEAMGNKKQKEMKKAETEREVGCACIYHWVRGRFELTRDNIGGGLLYLWLISCELINDCSWLMRSLACEDLVMLGHTALSKWN